MTIKNTLFLCLLLASIQTLEAQNWQLAWSDEFNGSSLDLANWQYDWGTGAQFGLNGWGNNELQYYTENNVNNVSVGGGNLTITAREESFMGQDYTSGRIKSLNLQYWTYGKIEARIDLPTGQGIWPAFWMLKEVGGWPGEIDITEIIGSNPNYSHGTCHYGVPGGVVSQGTSLYSADPYPNDFHIYTVEWYPDNIVWYIDGIQFFQVDRSSVFPDHDWLFAEDYFLLLNVAVGGNWPGSPDASTVFPQEMIVDWVRVYSYDPAWTNTVTFNVDMSDETLNVGDVVYVNGSFNGWCGTCNPMTDNGNGTWSTSLPLPPGIHEYKFTTNGFAGLVETFAGGEPCTLTTYSGPDTFVNRYVNTGWTDVNLPFYCFNNCFVCNGAPGCTDPDAANYDPSASLDDGSCIYAVNFSVDMSLEGLNPGDGVYVNGSFNGWCGPCNPLQDGDGDDIWTGTINLPPGSHEYLFTINGWEAQEVFAVGEPCTLTTGEFTNRQFNLGTAPTDEGPYCYNSCSPCPSTEVWITFRVDMSNETLNDGNVFLMGDFQGWDPSSHPMNYISYGIYELTLQFTSGITIEYLFVDGAAPIQSESISGPCVGSLGRSLALPSVDTILDHDCFEICGHCLGCNDPLDANYNPFADLDPAACTGPPVWGCTYTVADNYNILATHDNGSCTFSLGSPCPTDLNGDGFVNTPDLLQFLGDFGSACP